MKNEARKKGAVLVKSNRNGVEKSYAAWIADLKRRYRATQIKAAVAVNSALIEFYWNLGKDISEKYPGEVYGGKFFDKLGIDLQRELPGASGFTKVNLIYCLKFYELYSTGAIVPQVVERSVRRGNGSLKMPQVAAKVSTRNYWTIRFCNNVLHNWSQSLGDIIVPSSTNAKVTATRRFSTYGGRSRMDGAAIRF